MEDQLPVPHLFIYFKAFLFVLNLPDKRCDTSVETLQMSVNRGVEGLPVVCVKDGKVVRVSVSPTGYGQALYV